MPQLPLDALDVACLAATRAPWSSFAPTWKLDLTGSIDRAAIQRALSWTAARYPSMSARIENGAWLLSDLQPLRLGDATDEQAVTDEFIDVSRGVLDVRLVGSTLLFHQHHALADGRAFLEMLGDFFRALDAAERGAPSPFDGSLVVRRRQAETVLERGLARLWLFFSGGTASVRELLTARLKPLDRLPSNDGTDYGGSHRTLHHVMPLARIEAVRPARAKHGLSSNDVLAGALVTALSRWSNRCGTHTLLMPVDIRPRTGFVSFANHLSNLQVRFRADPSVAPLEHAKALAASVAVHRNARTPWKRVLFDAMLTKLAPLSTLQRALLDERPLLTNFSFSNLLPLGVPGGDSSGTWSTSRLRVERLRITTPCVPPQAVNLTVVQSGSDAVFNFNFKDSAIDEGKVRALRDLFDGAFDELSRALG